MSLAQVRFLQRRPTLRPKQIRPWVAAWGVRKVWATLRREHELRVSKKRLWAIMKANGLVLARDSEPGEPTRGHVAMPEPNRRLAADFTTAWTKLDGVITVVPTIDCGFRSVLGLEVTKDQQAPAVLASVKQSLREAFGEPSSVQVDLELRTDHHPSARAPTAQTSCVGGV